MQLKHSHTQVYGVRSPPQWVAGLCFEDGLHLIRREAKDIRRQSPDVGIETCARGDRQGLRDGMDGHLMFGEQMRGERQRAVSDVGVRSYVPGLINARGSHDRERW